MRSDSDSAVGGIGSYAYVFLRWSREGVDADAERVIGRRRIRLDRVWRMRLWRRMGGRIMFIRMEVSCTKGMI